VSASSPWPGEARHSTYCAQQLVGPGASPAGSPVVVEQQNAPNPPRWPSTSSLDAPARRRSPGRTDEPRQPDARLFSMIAGGRVAPCPGPGRAGRAWKVALRTGPMPVFHPSVGGCAPCPAHSSPARCIDRRAAHFLRSASWPLSRPSSAHRFPVIELGRSIPLPASCGCDRQHRRCPLLARRPPRPCRAKNDVGAEPRHRSRVSPEYWAQLETASQRTVEPTRHS